MMEALTYPSARQVVVCGDIHGSFISLVHKVCIQYGMKDTLVIVAGDCGFGFGKQAYYEDIIYRKVARRLSAANNWIVMLRGNHDDPSYFRESKMSHGRFRTVPDYTIVRSCGHTILLVGGATSIDRNYRKNEMKKSHRPLYWPDEAPCYDADALAAIKDKYEVDSVVTHTAPSFCEKDSHVGLQEWAMYDSTLIEDCRREREVMDRLFRTLKDDGHPLGKWFYGHFHSSWYSVIQDTAFSMLDIMELKVMWDDDCHENN